MNDHEPDDVLAARHAARLARLKESIEALPLALRVLFSQWRPAVEAWGRSSSIYGTSLAAIERFVADLAAASGTDPFVAGSQATPTAEKRAGEYRQGPGW